MPVKRALLKELNGGDFKSKLEECYVDSEKITIEASSGFNRRS